MRPEILDGLPENSRAAQASRKDLRLINRLLRSNAWFRRMLQGRLQPNEGVLEVGAGVGDLGLALRPLIPLMAGLDLCRRPDNWAPSSKWFQTDVLSFPDWSEFPVVLGNLFYHHFDGSQLRAIGAQLNRHARLIIASEPLRKRPIVRWFSLLCWVLRSHPVTRHDGRVSIAAGFRENELPHLLGLDPAIWSWRVSECWPGVYRLLAQRRS